MIDLLRKEKKKKLKSGKKNVFIDSEKQHIIGQLELIL